MVKNIFTNDFASSLDIWLYWYAEHAADIPPQLNPYQYISLAITGVDNEPLIKENKNTLVKFLFLIVSMLKIFLDSLFW